MHNLLVELDERYDPQRVALEKRRIESAGFDIAIHNGASDRVLAWIDDTFGGVWSSEAYAGANVVVSRANGAPVAFATFDARGLQFAWLRGVAREEGVGLFGPFGVEPSSRRGSIGRAVLAIALCELRARGYRRALIGAVGAPELLAYYARETGASIVETFEIASFVPRAPRTVLLASGSGTNAQAVIDRVRAGLPLDLRAVVSNKANAKVLDRARAANVHAEIVAWDRALQSRAEYDATLLERVASYEPELVLLLGWMHLLDGRFVDAFPELLNVHPAFLPLDSSRDRVGMPDGSEIPAFRGAHAVRDAFAAGSRWIGATVHGVTLETDRGPVYARKPLQVRAGESEAEAHERLHIYEHQIVEAAIKRWLYER